MEPTTKKGNALIWVLVIVVILIGLYFIMKTDRGAENQYNNDTAFPSNDSSSAELEAGFNSANTELDAIDVDGVDEGL